MKHAMPLMNCDELVVSPGRLSVSELGDRRVGAFERGAVRGAGSLLRVGEMRARIGARTYHSNERC